MLLTPVMGLGLIGLALIGLGWLLWPHPDSGVVRSTRATVVESVLCGSSGTRDVVRIDLLDGHDVLARLDGCGHRLGEVLTVELPDPLPEGELLARLQGTGVPAARAAGQRLGAVGVALAGVAGALLAWRLRTGWGAPHRRVDS